MGRAPDAFQLRFGYQGYMTSEEDHSVRLKVSAQPQGPHISHLLFAHSGPVRCRV